MKNFQKIAGGIDVLPLAHALQRQPDLWNLNTFRTTFVGTPHVDVDDIWLRFCDPSKVQTDDNTLARNDSAPIWYPAWDALKAAKPIILGLMHRVEGYELGRVLITRIKPGGRILPHADNQGEYVHLGDIGRYHVVIQGLPGSLFRCGTEQVCMETGEIWWFNAHEEHEVVNNSRDDRIHLIMDIRTC